MKNITRQRLVELLNINSRQTIINKPFFYNGVNMVAKLIHATNPSIKPGIYIFEASDKNTKTPIFKVLDN